MVGMLNSHNCTGIEHGGNKVIVWMAIYICGHRLSQFTQDSGVVRLAYEVVKMR